MRFRNTETSIMPAGKYYIGDLCYVMHDVWDEFCDLTIQEQSVLDGVFSLENGVKFATFCTAWGDGGYRDVEGREYSVDAGLIGCIRLEDIGESEADNTRCGHIVEFTEDFGVDSHDGVIRFGDVYIDTDPSPSYEDEDEETD